MRKINVGWHDMEDGVSHDKDIEIGDSDDPVTAGFEWFKNYIDACPGLKRAGASTIDIESISEVIGGKLKFHFSGS